MPALLPLAFILALASAPYAATVAIDAIAKINAHTHYPPPGTNIDPAKAKFVVMLGRTGDGALADGTRTDGGTGTCSGFWVSQDLIATAGHCVDEPLGGPVFAYDLDGRVLPLALVGYSAMLGWPDVALLRTNITYFDAQPVELRCDKETEIKEDVWLVGFPNGEGPIWTNGKVASMPSSDPTGFPGWQSPAFMITAVSAGGSSGGPVIDGDGKVVGILKGGINQLSVVTPVKHLCHFFHGRAWWPPLKQLPTPTPDAPPAE